MSPIRGGADIVDKGSIAAPCIHQHELALLIEKHGVRLRENLAVEVTIVRR